jgi:hypothetical protein
MNIPFGTGLGGLWDKAKSAFGPPKTPTQVTPAASAIIGPTQAHKTTPLDQNFFTHPKLPLGRASAEIALEPNTCPVETTPVTPMQLSRFIDQIQTEQMPEIIKGQEWLSGLAESHKNTAATRQTIQASLLSDTLNDETVLTDALKTAMNSSNIPLPADFSLATFSQSCKDLSEPQLRNLIHTLQSQYQRMAENMEQITSTGDNFGSDTLKATDLAKAKKMLEPLLKTELPKILKIKQDYLKFESQVKTQRNALVDGMNKFAQENGIEIPAELLKSTIRDPFNAKFKLDTWLSTQRSKFAAQPDKLQALNSLELFSIQLTNVSEILSRVEHGENIDQDTLNKYVMFQTFITVKDKLFQAYENSTGPQKEKLRAAIFNLSQLFSGLEPTPEAFRSRLENWLGQYLSPEDLAKALSSLDGQRQELERHNGRVDNARNERVSLPDSSPTLPPVPAASRPGFADQLLQIEAITRRQEVYYQHVYAEKGEAGLSTVLHQERESVLSPLLKTSQLGATEPSNAATATSSPKISPAVAETLKSQSEELRKKILAKPSKDTVQEQFDKIRQSLRQMLHKNQQEFRSMQQKLNLQKILTDMFQDLQSELKYQDQNFQDAVHQHSESLLREMQTEIQKIPLGTGLIQL